MSTLPTLLTPEQVAAWLGITKKSLYAKVERGQIPVVRIGKLLRFQADQLTLWIADSHASQK